MKIIVFGLFLFSICFIQAEETKIFTAHVVVILADNANQGIVPIPEALGNGQSARNNLYWGALYGVKTFMLKKGGWKKETISKPKLEPHVLDYCLMSKSIGENKKIYLLAEAWDGSKMEEFFAYFSSAYTNDLSLVIDKSETTPRLIFGDSADFLIYIGHNILMDILALDSPNIITPKSDQGIAVFACVSKMFFHHQVKEWSNGPFVFTNGLMAPEAYSLNALVTTWFSTHDPKATHLAIAEAYSKYQKCSLNAAKRLFSVIPKHIGQD